MGNSYRDLIYTALGMALTASSAAAWAAEVDVVNSAPNIDAGTSQAAEGISGSPQKASIRIAVQMGDRLETFTVRTNPDEAQVDMNAQQSHARELASTTEGRTPKTGFDSDDVSAEEVRAFIQETSTELLPDAWKGSADEITDAIIEEANANRFDPLFLLAVIKHESVFNPGAKGMHGEIGLMQLKPSAARWVTDLNKLPKKFDLKSPRDNIRIGASFLGMLRGKFKSDAGLYLAAYNMGATNVRTLLKENRRPALYSGKVMKEYDALYETLTERYARNEVAQSLRGDGPFRVASLQITAQ